MLLPQQALEATKNVLALRPVSGVEANHELPLRSGMAEPLVTKRVASSLGIFGVYMHQRPLRIDIVSSHSGMSKKRLIFFRKSGPTRPGKLTNHPRWPRGVTPGGARGWRIALWRK
jgi:hypothetical protein